MVHLDEALRLAREATAPTGAEPGTYQNPTLTVREDGRISAIEEGESTAASLDVAEMMTLMDGSLGGTWWFQRPPQGAGGGPTTIWVGDGLTKSDGSACSYRVVVCVQAPVPVGETWVISVYRYGPGVGEWVYATGVEVAAGAYRAITPAFTLSAGELLAVASVADVGPEYAQLSVRRG